MEKEIESSKLHILLSILSDTRTRDTRTHECIHWDLHIHTPTYFVIYLTTNLQNEEKKIVY